MSYLVRWKPAAERQLARIWTDATDKAAVTRAADAFDATIQRAPLNVGESRPGRSRIAYNTPLGFLFDVYPESGEVEVISVWRIRD
jgi:hypothetical protein